MWIPRIGADLSFAFRRVLMPAREKGRLITSLRKAFFFTNVRCLLFRSCSKVIADRSPWLGSRVHVAFCNACRENWRLYFRYCLCSNQLMLLPVCKLTAALTTEHVCNSSRLYTTRTVLQWREGEEVNESTPTYTVKAANISLRFRPVLSTLLLRWRPCWP